MGWIATSRRRIDHPAQSKHWVWTYCHTRAMDTYWRCWCLWHGAWVWWRCIRRQQWCCLFLQFNCELLTIFYALTFTFYFLWELQLFYALYLLSVHFWNYTSLWVLWVTIYKSSSRSWFTIFKTAVLWVYVVFALQFCYCERFCDFVSLNLRFPLVQMKPNYVITRNLRVLSHES